MRLIMTTCMIATVYITVFTVAKILFKLLYIPGQQWVLQSMVVIFPPSQSLPPQLGLGWVQLCHWVNVPPPQDAEHSVWLYQGLQPPSTDNKVCN